MWVFYYPQKIVQQVITKHNFTKHRLKSKRIKTAQKTNTTNHSRHELEYLVETSIPCVLASQKVFF